MSNSFVRSLKPFDHYNIAIYGDDPLEALANRVRKALDDIEFRIFFPKDIETLMEAAHNCALVIVNLDHVEREHLTLAQKIRADHMSVCEIIAVADSSEHDSLNTSLLLRDFDLFFALSEFSDKDLKKILTKRLVSGSQKLSRAIQEEEYRRFRDALSCAPASVIGIR